MAALRAESVREGLFARLGAAAWRAYFRVLADDRDSFGFVSHDQHGLAGFVVLTTEGLRIERRVLSRHPSLWFRAALAGLRSPRLFVRAAWRIRLVLTGGKGLPDDGEPRLRLLDIAVSPPARGRGHGRALLTAAIAEAARRRHVSIGLSVLAANGAARRLYESSGFVTSRHGVRDDGQPYVTMRLDRVADPGASSEPVG